MAEPLKNHYGRNIPTCIAAMIEAVYPAFGTRAFLRDVLRGYDALELMPRGRHIAHALHRHLPDDYSRAIKILLDSLNTKIDKPKGSMASFLYLPHTMFVAFYGLDHFELSMRAQHRLTQLFTAEFSIRSFLERHPQKTLTQMRVWARDPSEHVRRLVSEGTRPRLPWAPRLRAFQADPKPVLELLELLKDDSELYVRRSVANNLNDIGKDHPALLIATAKKWAIGASPQRRWIIEHALRSAAKCGDRGAMQILGFGRTAQVSITDFSAMPAQPRIGGAVRIVFTLANTGKKSQDLRTDLRVHFVKSSGRTGAKVFRLKTMQLAPRADIRLEKKLSLAELTTRKHYAGVHRIELLCNGQAQPLGSFKLLASK